jgi:hypothetical protein
LDSPEELDLNKPAPHESHLLLEVLKATATEEEKRAAKEAWDKLPWWKKEDYQAEYELDLL